MICIFEGIDKVGKTVRAEEFAAIENFKYFRFDGRKLSKGFSDEQVAIAKQFAFGDIARLIDKRIINDVVFDRSFISMIAYDIINAGIDTREFYFDAVKNSINLIRVYYYEISDPSFTAKHFSSIDEMYRHRDVFDDVIKDYISRGGNVIHKRFDEVSYE